MNAQFTNRPDPKVFYKLYRVEKGRISFCENSFATSRNNIIYKNLSSG